MKYKIRCLWACTIKKYDDGGDDYDDDDKFIKCKRILSGFSISLDLYAFMFINGGESPHIGSWIDELH